MSGFNFSESSGLMTQRTFVLSEENEAKQEIFSDSADVLVGANVNLERVYSERSKTSPEEFLGYTRNSRVSP
jgi:hypothetical protein